MENYRINCGASLKRAPYTQPREDGDNKEGYWTCQSCGDENIDWASTDNN